MHPVGKFHVPLQSRAPSWREAADWWKSPTPVCAHLRNGNSQSSENATGATPFSSKSDWIGPSRPDVRRGAMFPKSFASDALSLGTGPSHRIGVLLGARLKQQSGSTNKHQDLGRPGQTDLMAAVL